MKTLPYDRAKAVEYARKWAYGRNPAFFDFEKFGGDCTSFASQALFAGSGVMNYTPTMGWYYNSAADRAPAWSGVIYLYNFLMTNRRAGPFASELPLDSAEPGDIIQLATVKEEFHHTPVVVARRAGGATVEDSILVAAHSDDCDMRPLSTYSIRKARLLHIDGVRR